MRQYTLTGHKRAVFSVEFSPVGNYLALGSYDHRATIWRYTRTRKIPSERGLLVNASSAIMKLTTDAA